MARLTGPRGTDMRLLLLPLKLLHRLLTWLNNLLYDRNLRKIHHLDKPVISIGNLAMGGTGKTPICADLADVLSQRGFRVAVLSRGYKRRNPHTVQKVDPHGDWRDYGDEPVMIAMRNPQALVCVGADRAAAAELARDWNPDVYLLDDGFQHRKLHRDCDLALLDVTRDMPGLWTRDLFREPWSALKRARAVALTRWDGRDTKAWEANIRRANPNAAIFRASFAPRRLTTLDGRHMDLSDLRGAAVAAYSGIARPAQFFDILGGLGARVTTTLALRDHQPITPKQLRQLTRQARADGAEMVVTTEKDAVKLDKTAPSAILVCFLAMDVKWEDPEGIYQLLHNIARRVG